MSKQKTTISAKDLIVDVEAIYRNVSQKVIVTTEDKVKLCLLKNLQNMEKRRSWFTPLGILITIITTLATTTFRNLGFEAPTWQAIFLIAGILSSAWLVYSLVQMPKAKKIEDIVKELKAQENQV